MGGQVCVWVWGRVAKEMLCGWGLCTLAVSRGLGCMVSCTYPFPGVTRYGAGSLGFRWMCDFLYALLQLQEPGICTISCSFLWPNYVRWW